MSEDQERQEVFSIVAVPNSIAAQVRDFAAALAEAEEPDVEGYALLRGIGSSGNSKGILMGDSKTGSDCYSTSKQSGGGDVDCTFLD